MMRLIQFKSVQTGLLALHIFLSILFFLCWGCGSDLSSNRSTAADEGGVTGLAEFSVLWQNSDPEDPAVVIVNRQVMQPHEALDCQALGIERVQCHVYDPAASQIASGGPWACSEHSGWVDAIPAGPGREFVILGLDVSDNIIYQGQTDSGISIVPGANQVGHINAFSFVAPLLLPVDRARVTVDDFTLNWQAVQSARQYRILISESSDLENPVIDQITPATTYSPLNLAADTTYYWTVQAVDQFLNQGHPDQVRLLTTVSADIPDMDPPSSPTGVTARAVSASRINLAWNQSSDDFAVMGYRIFQDGSLRATTAAITYGDRGLLPETTYCYRIDAFDAAGNRSEQSDQACATTFETTTWYRDADGDGFGNPRDSREAEEQPPGYVPDNLDCNDTDADVYPGAPETCGDDIDQDCNGSDDICPPDGDDVDDDGDGFTENQGDCNDADRSIHPQAEENCGDGVDQDCDGTDPICPPPDSNDVDDDGDGFTENNGDCNDADDSIYPGAEEICDNIDQDCDDEIYDGCGPTISNISYDERGWNTTCYYDPNGEPVEGDLFGILFDYSDPDGDIYLVESDRVLVPYDNTRHSTDQGNGFSGSITTRVCFDSIATPSQTYRVTLVDAAGNRSNTLTITIDVPPPALYLYPNRIYLTATGKMKPCFTLSEGLKQLQGGSDVVKSKLSQ